MTKDNHDLNKPELNSGGTGGQVEQILEDQAAAEAPLLKDKAVRIETPIELGAEGNATTAMVAADGPLTGTALSLLPDALSMMAANPLRPILGVSPAGQPAMRRPLLKRLKWVSPLRRRPT